MSIERMDSIFLIVPSYARERFIDWLYDERQVHVREFIETPDEWSTRFSKIVTEKNPTHVEAQVIRLQVSVEILMEFQKNPVDFLESLFPVKTITTMKAIDDTEQTVNPDVLLSECQKLNHELTAVQGEHTRLVAERLHLNEFSFISSNIATLRSLKYYALHIVSASGHAQTLMLSDPRVQEQTHIEPAITRESSNVFLIAVPVENEAVIQEIITDYGLHELELPEISGTIHDAIASIDLQLEKVSAQEKTLHQKGIEFAKEWLDRAELALASWESIKQNICQEQYMISSSNMFAARGYIRAKQREIFASRLEQTFPGAELVSFPTPKSDEPPVSLTWNRFLRPAGLLVKMFGLPSYKSIDPTGFLAFSFFIFFGICFGDVLYGFMLIGVAYLLQKRFHDQKGLVQFFRLFSYAGVTTVIFGILTGSWGADLPAYFGKGNAIDQLRMKLTLLDPLAKPIVALVAAITIGVTNQLYGIFVRIYRDTQRGDVSSAIYDGVFWVTYLVSLITFAISLSVGASHLILYVALTILICSALGLVATQGRAEKGLPARLITGIVSLYGIVGTYGTTTFLGDVISYSRLMAIGMTTTVVGMSFNIIANMVREVPAIGMVLFVVVIIFGHMFNFVMSILTAFVHSARLILLEWFGRFYEGGGLAFQPYGFFSPHYDVDEQ